MSRYQGETVPLREVFRMGAVRVGIGAALAMGVVMVIMCAVTR